MACRRPGPRAAPRSRILTLLAPACLKAFSLPAVPAAKVAMEGSSVPLSAMSNSPAGGCLQKCQRRRVRSLVEGPGPAGAATPPAGPLSIRRERLQSRRSEPRRGERRRNATHLIHVRAMLGWLGGRGGGSLRSKSPAAAAVQGERERKRRLVPANVNEERTFFGGEGSFGRQKSRPSQSALRAARRRGSRLRRCPAAVHEQPQPLPSKAARRAAAGRRETIPGDSLLAPLPSGESW